MAEYTLIIIRSSDVETLIGVVPLFDIIFIVYIIKNVFAIYTL